MTAEATETTRPIDELGLLHHVALVVADLDATARWYDEKLGWRCIRRFALPEHNVAFALLQSPGGLIFELIEKQGSDASPTAHGDLSVAGNIQGFVHVAFVVADCDAVATELEARGVTVIVPPHDAHQGDMRSAFFHDYDGNLLEVVQLF